MSVASADLRRAHPARPPEPDLSALLTDDVLEWMTLGSCNGRVSRADDPWFAEVDQREQTRSAQRICAQCPVVERCLEFALDARIEYGVWGATTPRQRRAMLRDRGVEAAA